MATPAFRIVADGKDITALIADRLVSIRVVDDQGQQSDSLELAIDDRDHLMPVPRSGAIIRVWMGYSSGGPAPVYMGAFAVDEVGMSMGGPRAMTIKATAATLAPKLVKEKKTRSWDGKTLGEIASQIAKEHGLKIQIKATAAQQQVKHEDQTNESDQSFLTRLADRYKAVIKPVGGSQDFTLIMLDRGAGQAGEMVTVDVKQVSDWRCTIKNRGAYSSVKAKYVDREGNNGVSSWKNTEKVVTIGGAGGGSASWSGQGGQLPPFELKKLYPTKKEAESAAQAKLQSLRSGEVSISLRMGGTPQFKFNAEGKVTLTNFRDYVDGEWHVKQVTHEIGPSGYVTSVDCGTPGDDNNSWAGMEDSGRGLNNSKPASEKANLLAGAASNARGMSTAGGPGAGNTACVYAVNKVLRSAGITPPWGNSNYVPDARAALAAGGGTQLSGPEPGAIAIMRDGGSPPYPHMGIVQNDGQIISNSSSRGSFSWVASPSSYAGYYGQAPEYWRLK